MSEGLEKAPSAKAGDALDIKAGDTLDIKSVESGDHGIDPVAEKKLVAKFDRWIVPFVMITYLLGFLDRVNIGNAALFGLQSDLGISTTQYQVAVSVLFTIYILSE